MRIILFTLLFLLSACGEQGPGGAEPKGIRPSDADIAYARSAQPEDEALASIYNRSCRNCHAVAGVNAPLTGHLAAWEPRLAQRSRDGLLQSTRSGYRAMPAQGLCRQCSDEDFLALIDFMLTPPD